MLQRKRILLLWGLALLALFGLSRSSFAQSSRPSRIMGRIAGSPAVWLEGNRRPIFQPENDLGPAPDSLKLENITLTFRPTADQQAGLATLLEEQQDRSSPLYHQWLTPEQFADNFGLSPADVAQVEAWLASQGFTVTRTARSRLWISFSGTAAQIRSAFLTEIHNYSLNGKTYYAPASEPAVPAVLADVVLGFTGLDSYRLQPRGTFRQVQAGPSPNFTSNISGNTFVTPTDFATIYDVQNLYKAGIDGAGQSIAVMGETDIQMSDIAAFRSASGLPPSSPTVVVAGTDPGTSTNTGVINEAALDIEWSGAVAPAAQIIYVNSSDAIFGSLRYAIDTKISNEMVPILSVSYGGCEQAEWTTAQLNQMAQLAEEANSQGQTIIASAGDSGAADCDYTSNPNSPVTSATHGLAVDAPASLPFVTGMGGSEFNEGAGTYWQATTSSGADVLASALSYIPEMVWNDTYSAQNTTHELLAGGGGASIFTPSGQPSKPTWQTGPGVPADNHRDVPDLSLNASPIHDSYLICAQGSCVNGYRNSNQTLSVAGGTSAAAPSFAGIVALINEQTSSSQGNINPTLYAMAQSAPAALHDITGGNNTVPCTAGTTNCASGGEIGFSAGPGYDEASGLGSVDAYNLVMEWPGGSGNLPAPSLSAPLNGATGQSLSPAFLWSQVTDNNGYVIMIAPLPAELTTIPSTSTCAAPCTVATTPANQNTYTPSPALAAGTYYWAVQAIPASGSGHGAWSGMFSFTTTGGSLSAPTLSAPVNGATPVNLPANFSWTSVSGNAGYRIMVASLASALPTNPGVGTCGGGCSLDTTTSATALASNTVSATALTGGTTYYWQVQALAPSGGGQNGPWSAALSFTTAPSDFSLSAAPSSLTVAPGTGGTATVTLTPINNFSATPNFTCSVSGTLAGVTCSAGTYSNNAVTVTITASATARTVPSLPPIAPFARWWLVAAALLLCGWSVDVVWRYASGEPIFPGLIPGPILLHS